MQLARCCAQSLQVELPHHLGPLGGSRTRESQAGDGGDARHKAPLPRHASTRQEGPSSRPATLRGPQSPESKYRKDKPSPSHQRRAEHLEGRPGTRKCRTWAPWCLAICPGPQGLVARELHLGRMVNGQPQNSTTGSLLSVKG